MFVTSKVLPFFNSLEKLLNEAVIVVIFAFHKVFWRLNFYRPAGEALYYVLAREPGGL